MGINWKGADGAQDLDLKYVDINQNTIGWNSSYYNENKSIIYSGDMTSANPEATELLYCKGCFPNAVIKVNLYNGDEKSKFTLFFAKTNSDYKAEFNHMVDPNDIIFSTQLEMSSQEMLVGIIHNQKFQFANIRTGNKRISNGDDITTNYINYCTQTADCYLDLKLVLQEAGFEFVDENADVDLSNLDKSNLINLLS